ncbi:hypothetical protein SAMD00023353_2500960 [Rosellinia necatrix]|uniref:Uncharacterized protein n=1 Tax=Rosellinia necatrix TaxID=77044 RepID=A0A1S8A821_ROSNE|nr:hypothetical protein SAMD00023353_2500960 [Rosellinia necatrix]
MKRLPDERAGSRIACSALRSGSGHCHAGCTTAAHFSLFGGITEIFKYLNETWKVRRVQWFGAST